MTTSSMYKPTDLAEIKKRLAAKESKGGGQAGSDNNLHWYKFPSGTERVVLRYLPSTSGVPGMIVKKHYNLPEVKDFICFRTHEMECDLCNLLRDYEHKMDVSDWQATSRSYLNALILTDPTKTGAEAIDPKVPHIVGQPEGNLYWVFKMINDPDVGDICDPFTGFNVAYNREEFNGKFNRVVLPKSAPIAPTPEEVDTILGKAVDLHKIWRRPDDVFLKKLQDITAKLKVVIDQRLLTLANAPDLPPNPDTTPVSAADTKAAMDMDPTHKPAPASTAAPKSNRPAGAPECYSDASVFYMTDGKADPSKQLCVSCPMDFHCGEAIKKRG